MYFIVLFFTVFFIARVEGLPNITSYQGSIYDTSNTFAKQSAYVYHHHFVDDAPVKLGQVKHHVFLYDLHDPYHLEYKAFCSGSIISDKKVLTSAHCLLTNRKRLKYNKAKLKVAAGVLTTLVRLDGKSRILQSRNISKIYSQYNYRFPYLNLAVLIIDKPWQYNKIINRIKIATVDHDYDGTCMITNAKPAESWYKKQNLVTNQVVFVQEDSCEKIFFRPRNYLYCVVYEYTRHVSREAEGGSLVCHGTGDPDENEFEGILVGVATVIHVGIPTVFHRVGLFHKYKYPIEHVKIMAGVLSTMVKFELIESTRQYRSVRDVHSQYSLRYPKLNLLIVIVNKRWKFNIFVNRIIVATMDQEFDGTCHVAGAAVSKTWSFRKNLVMNELTLVNTDQCASILYLVTEMFYCTYYRFRKITVAPESEGAGLICFGTNDPAETEPEGILVGVSTMPSTSLPTLHNRIAVFQDWLQSKGNRLLDKSLLIYCLLFFKALK